ncbi:TetR/AcrR family transcriptional regulator [Streptomyces cocklensis]|jgi:AcrR family transcriptional regulator|uniref:TetR/AcrR family transcriptional regulator n=1 Tax=Actinacidiphila cocklensis TaxID=887465 RepID=A0A9W4E1S5_9ACTN|nr:TetR/AcrR family transcriptional regulator [Actinacidiphila cocklensis]MDD1063732.1 TetR/AcrR family transcriptional regulator [Actinacidiphila cocklensis]WSX72927.1 TetR/AcrR family transcriptional regulator [Streptomyces sp. NBC_00899]WSX81005.1 TetR/AcrR family transcriptional regulator [Streptomyces sp. NBC_00899]CAG6391050.1 TetR/AcrR family transcriptional regulator [Actinacidiphila cocklensis]
MGGDEASIWMQPERSRRASPGPQRAYSRQQVVRAAIKIADEDGLPAASMRRIAAEIGAGTMTLYQYVRNREDLIELIVDEVTGEMGLPDRPSGEWRADLSDVVVAKRALYLRHTWLATRVPGHPVWGPNSLHLQEFLLSSFDGFEVSVDEAVSLIGLLNGYVESFVRAEVGWQEEARRTGVDMQEWMRRTAPYARQLVLSGKYPRFARVLMENTSPHMEPDARFQYGLDRVLDSIEASLKPGA